jgi:hypothetical protein
MSRRLSGLAIDNASNRDAARRRAANRIVLHVA